MKNLKLCSVLMLALIFYACLEKIPANITENDIVGINTHTLTYNNKQALKALSDLRPNFIRVDIEWRYVETEKCKFSWCGPDLVIQNALNLDIAVLPILGYTPDWATEGKIISGVPKSPDFFYKFVKEFCFRYNKKIKYIEIWNEPESQRFWDGSIKDYIEYIIKPARKAIDEIDENIKIVGPASGDFNFIKEFAKEGGFNYIDIISLHIYACCNNTDDAQKVLWRLDGTNGWPWEMNFKSILDGYGINKPIWITETGWKACTEEWKRKQGEYYIQLLEGMEKRDYLCAIFFYELNEGVCDTEQDQGWGMLDNNWKPKPSYFKLKEYLNAFTE